ncbi:MAG: putative diguanylate cyclase/phosphodiesterase with sensor, partial [Actinotalea sp.]|nr:putative diguanylate cyclase/phosphodiesterase with sensor [Actinotalea sp.]
MDRFVPRTSARPATRAPARSTVLSSRLLRVLVVAAATNVVLFALELSQSVPWSQPVGQALNPVIAVMAEVLCRRAATDPGTTPAAQRIWHLTTWGMGFIAASITVRLVAALGPAQVAPIGDVLQVVGAVLLSWSVLLIPLGVRTRSEKTALCLDVATVIVAVGVVVWHVFGASHGVLTSADARAIGPVMGAALVTAFLATRALLSGSEVVPSRTLSLRVVSAVVGGFGSAVSVLLLAARPEVDARVLLNPIAALAIALSACFQITDGPDAHVRARRRRRYSTLPYAAVLVVDALLVRTAATGSSDQLVVAVAAVALTALVVVRQLVAFRENDSLLTRLGDQEQQLCHEATHD